MTTKWRANSLTETSSLTTQGVGATGARQDGCTLPTETRLTPKRGRGGYNDGGGSEALCHLLCTVCTQE